MDLNILLSRWENISKFEEKKGFKALRITYSSIPDLFIALDEDGFRYLLLYLPSALEIKIKETNKDKLNLEYLKDGNIISIKLNDLNFKDLFNDLIISLYNKIKDISDPIIYSKTLIQTFYKWSEFFDNHFQSKLSPEEIKGLFGEIWLLNTYLERADPSTINEFLDSWKGPYNTTNDFVFDQKNLEVKTKEDSKSFISISSEYQLERELDKALELIVLSVKLDILNGESIYDLLKITVDYVRENFGDLTTLFRALSQKGLTIESSTQYNNFRFLVSGLSSYDCCHDDFPKLSTSNIPNEISNLRYDLRTSMLNKFLIKESNF